jgi:hypothetical protein
MESMECPCWKTGLLFYQMRLLTLVIKRVLILILRLLVILIVVVLVGVVGVTERVDAQILAFY